MKYCKLCIKILPAMGLPFSLVGDLFDDCEKIFVLEVFKHLNCDLGFMAHTFGG